MKARLLFVPGIIMLVAGGITPVRADSADEKAIRAMYVKLEQAFKNKDMDAIMALSTKDFTEKMPDGKVLSAKEAEQQMRQEFAMTKEVKSVSMHPDSIKVSGKNATVMGTFKFTDIVVDSQGMMGPKGAQHTLSGSGKSRVKLVKTAEGWRFKSEEGLSMKATMDGKPFNPMAPPPKPKKK